MTTNTPNGFTLVETLVAVLLLTMTIILPYYAIQRSLSATFSARDDLIASGLAQEAVEYVRGVRDNNYLAGLGWLHGIDGGTGESDCINNFCTVDATKGSDPYDAIKFCQTPQPGIPPCIERPLYLNAANHYYHITPPATPQDKLTRFVRYIRVERVGSTGTVVKVTATVTWTYRGTHTVTVTDYLTNWL